jgi:hypothetical protein
MPIVIRLAPPSKTPGGRLGIDLVCADIGDRHDADG